MRIVIGGDICPTGRNESLFCEKTDLLSSAADILRGYDLVIANLECPLIKRSTPIQKGGPVLGAPVDAGKGLTALGIHLVNLGNNHILDHGNTGLADTFVALEKCGIKHVGAGADLESAQKPFFHDDPQAPIAVLAFSECEYSYATSKRGGASPFNMNAIVRQLKTLPDHCFKLILLHGGNEHFPLPSPPLQDCCRLMIELGANAVICQHSHCIGGYETHQDGLIVYGQGNLILDSHYNRNSWREGILVELEVEGESLSNFNFIPVMQDPGQSAFYKMDDQESQTILNQMDAYRDIIVDPNQLTEAWEKFCETRKRVYQSLLFGHSRFGYFINKTLGTADLKPKTGKMNIGNVLRCFSHLEAVRTIYSLEATTEKIT